MVWYCNVCKKNRDVLANCEEEVFGMEDGEEDIKKHKDFRLGFRCVECDSQDLEWV